MTPRHSLSLLLIYATCALAVVIEKHHEYGNDELDAVVGESKYDNKYRKRFPRDVDTDDINIISDTFLGNKLNKSVNPCENPISYVCITDNPRGFGVTANRSKLKSMEEIKDYTISILNERVKSNELKSSRIEKQLFQMCMNLEEAELLTLKEEIPYIDLFSLILNIVTNNKTWQDMDKRLSDHGFGHYFFEIKIVHHPEVPNHNIIQLEPPQFDVDNVGAELSVTNRLFHMLGHSFAEAIVQEIKPLDSTKAILRFVESLMTIIYDSNAKGDDDFSKPMALDLWNDVYQSKGHNRYASVNKLNWIQTLKDEFQRVNITINSDELIVLKHPKYFEALASLLASTPNEVIAETILSSKVMRLLKKIHRIRREPDVDMKAYHCSKMFKLHAIPYVVMKNLDKQIDVTLRKNLHDIEENIINVLSSEIEKSNMHQAEKTYLKSELKAVKLNIFGKIDEDYVSNYYENYEVGYSFLFSSLNFQRMLKDKELRNLRRISDLPSDYLMSVTSTEDMFNLHNIIAYAIHKLRHKVNAVSTLTKETLYGTYGEKIASAIHEILMREILRDSSMKLLLIERDMYTRNDKYSPAVSQCFADKFANMDTMDSFGLEIANKAMLEDFHTSSFNTSGDQESANQHYYLSFVNFNCWRKKDTMRKILSNSPGFSNTFKCQFSPTNKCGLTAFSVTTPKN